MQPEEFTLAFSVWDRNAPQLEESVLRQYVDFFYYKLEKEVKSQPVETMYRAAKCNELYESSDNKDF